MSSSGTNNNTTKTYGSKKPTSVFSGFSSFSSSFGFGRSAQSSFNDRLNTKPETSDEIDDWLSAFNDPSFGKENNATNQNNGRTESRVPKEIRGDNRKRDDDEGISSTNRDIRRPKDLKALLGAHTFEDLERILRILDNGTQQYNKFLGMKINITSF